MKQEKTDKRYILITKKSNVTAYYSEKNIGEVLQFDQTGKYYFEGVQFGKYKIAVGQSDAIEVTPVVIDGMLYAVNGYAKSGDYFIDDGNIYKMGTVRIEDEPYFKIIASSNPKLISDGVLPIKNADDVLRGLELTQSEFNDTVNEASENKSTTVFHSSEKAAPVPADTGKPDFQDYPEIKPDASMQEVKGNNIEAVEFGVWYSGMRKERVQRAYQRWLREHTPNTAAYEQEGMSAEDYWEGAHEQIYRDTDHKAIDVMRKPMFMLYASMVMPAVPALTLNKSDEDLQAEAAAEYPIDNMGHTERIIEQQIARDAYFKAAKKYCYTGGLENVEPIIKKHLWFDADSFMKASVQFYYENGKVSGNLYLSIEKAMKEYALQFQKSGGEQKTFTVDDMREAIWHFIPKRSKQYVFKDIIEKQIEEYISSLK